MEISETTGQATCARCMKDIQLENEGLALVVRDMGASSPILCGPCLAAVLQATCARIVHVTGLPDVLHWVHVSEGIEIAANCDACDPHGCTFRRENGISVHWDHRGPCPKNDDVCRGCHKPRSECTARADKRSVVVQKTAAVGSTMSQVARALETMLETCDCQPASVAKERLLNGGFPCPYCNHVHRPDLCGPVPFRCAHCSGAVPDPGAVLGTPFRAGGAKRLDGKDGSDDEPECSGRLPMHPQDEPECDLHGDGTGQALPRFEPPKLTATRRVLPGEVVHVGPGGNVEVKTDPGDERALRIQLAEDYEEFKKPEAPLEFSPVRLGAAPKAARYSCDGGGVHPTSAGAYACHAKTCTVEVGKP